jgi:hypothetical protein
MVLPTEDAGLPSFVLCAVRRVPDKQHAAHDARVKECDER